MRLSAALAGAPRGAVFGAFLVCAFLNVAVLEGAELAARDGWASALLGALGISVIVWLGQILTVTQAIDDNDARGVDTADLLVLTVGVVMLWAPLAPAGMAAQTLICAHLLLRPGGRSLRRGATLGLMVTLPMLWGPLALILFSDLALAADAMLVAAAIGADVIGNAVVRPDVSGYVKISQPCSSLSNISLALLSWTLFLHLFDRRYGAYL